MRALCRYGLTLKFPGSPDNRKTPELRLCLCSYYVLFHTNTTIITLHFKNPSMTKNTAPFYVATEIDDLILDASLAGERVKNKK